VLAPNATIIATQRLVRQSTAIEGGHANQLGVQMRLTRVTPQPGHSVDHSVPQRVPGKFNLCFPKTYCHFNSQQV
jgi:hypothetical protein